MKTVIFIHSIDAIKQEVDKRTSYIGKMRADGNGRNLLDRLSLTDGEDFLRKEFLDEAATETYDWLKAFGRNIKNGCQVNAAMNKVEYGVNHGIVVKSNDEAVATPVVLDINNSGIMYVNGAIIAPFNNIVRVEALRDAHVETNIHIEFKVTNGSDSFWVVQDEKDLKVLHTGDSAIIGNPHVGNSLLWFYQLNNGDTVSDVRAELQIVSATPDAVFKIKKGDCVVITDEDGTKHYSIAMCDSDELSYKPFCDLPYDPSNAIIFTLEKLPWWDDNMYKAVERNIKEAIVEYIIYRWFQVVLPDEADAHYDNFEDKAHKAQLGMNTENHTLKRSGALYIH